MTFSLRKLSALVFLLALSCHLHSQSLPKITAKFQDSPLTEVFQLLESDYGISFSYEDKAVAGIQVTSRIKKKPLDRAMQQILLGTGLGFEIVDNQYVLIKSGLSEQYSSPTLPQSSICGYVFDKTVNEPLPGATAYIKNSPFGTSTDLNGYFKLTGDIQKTDSLEIRFLGYESLVVPLVAFLDQPCKYFKLDLSASWMPDVLIQEFSIDMVTLEENGNFHFKNKKMPTLPGWGEPDVMRMLQLLPGIGSAEESAARLNVRGGTPDQNLVLWEGIPVYHAGHFFGLYDSFNPYVVKEVDVWRGNFGTDYGGRNASVIDIQGRPDFVKESTWGVGFNLLHINAFMEKPLFRKSPKKEGAILVAFRRSWVDAIDSRTYAELFDQVFQNGRIALQQEIQNENQFATWSPLISYGDFNLKFRWKGKEGNDNSISVFSSSDDHTYEFSFDDSTNFQTSKDYFEAINFGMSWQHKADWNAKLQADYTLALSTYTNQYIFEYNQDNRSRDFLYRRATDNFITEGSVRLHHRWQINEKHRFSFGYNLNAQEAWFESRDSVHQGDPTETASLDSTRTGLHTLYATLDYQVNDKFGFSVGMRQNQFPLRNIYYSEPRISFIWRPLWDGFSINGGLGRYWQFVFQIIDYNDLGVGEPLWYLATEEVPAQELWQWTLGMRYEKPSLLVDLEFYLKDSRNLTSLNQRIDLGLERPISFDGTSEAIGMDFMLRKRLPPYSIWFSYSLGKVENQFAALNSGLPYPARHDIRHQLNWVNMLNLGKWNFSANFHFRTGSPYTEPNVVEVPCPTCTQDDTTFELDFGALNANRLNSTIRIDVSATYEFGRANRKWKMGLAFYNLFDRDNLIDREYLLSTPDKDQPQTSYDLRELDRLAAGLSPNFFLQYEW
ncbi:MAG: carboxypeptidase-like regulatory domain-containing protein [Bacteroidota bacterium]